MDSLWNSEPINKSVKLVKLKYYNLTLISTQAPIEEKHAAVKEEFYTSWKRYVIQFPIMTCKQY
jgi:hypothetical protein